MKVYEREQAQHHYIKVHKLYSFILNELVFLIMLSLPWKTRLYNELQLKSETSTTYYHSQHQHTLSNDTYPLT